MTKWCVARNKKLIIQDANVFEHLMTSEIHYRIMQRVTRVYLTRGRKIEGESHSALRVERARQSLFYNYACEAIKILAFSQREHATLGGPLARG